MQQHSRLDAFPTYARLTRELNWARHWERCTQAPADAVVSQRALDEEVEALFYEPAATNKNGKPAAAAAVDEDALYRQVVKHIEKRVKK